MGEERRCWGVGAAKGREDNRWAGGEEVGTGAEPQCLQRGAIRLAGGELIRLALVYYIFLVYVDCMPGMMELNLIHVWILLGFDFFC